MVYDQIWQGFRFVLTNQVIGICYKPFDSGNRIMIQTFENGTREWVESYNNHWLARAKGLWRLLKFVKLCCSELIAVCIAIGVCAGCVEPSKKETIISFLGTTMGGLIPFEYAHVIIHVYPAAGGKSEIGQLFSLKAYGLKLQPEDLLGMFIYIYILVHMCVCVHAYSFYSSFSLEKFIHVLVVIPDLDAARCSVWKQNPSTKTAGSPTCRIWGSLQARSFEPIGGSSMIRLFGVQ